MRQPLRSISISFATIALIATGLGCHAGHNAGQSCAEMADCRPELVCLDGECTVPGACPSHVPVDCGDGTCCPQALGTCCGDGNCYGSTAECKAATCNSIGGTCRFSSDCCTGLTCRGSLCASPAMAVCGNGKCEAGETQGTCCADCGCPTGLICQAGSCKATGTVLNWTVSNGCLNGEDVQFSFFSQSRSAVWPGGGLAYVSKPGSTVEQGLSCIAGEKICFGGNQPAHGLSWGVGIGNSINCTDCCATCANASVSYGPLGCP